jgi:hypothetical protein
MGLKLGLGDWLSVLGLLIAIVQIWRTGRIVRATNRAVNSASQRVSLYNILLVIPELSRVSNDLDNAAMSNNKEAARKALVEWRHLASDFKGLLANEGLSDNGIEKLVQQSLAQSRVAKNQIVDGGAVSVLDSTKKARDSIDATCVQAKTLAAMVRSSASALGPN